MNKTGILGVAVVVLTCVCALLVYDRGQLKEQISAQGTDVAPTVSPPISMPAVAESPAATPPPVQSQPPLPPTQSAVALPASPPRRDALDTSDFSPAQIAQQRKNLDQLPSWLRLPDSKKDELAVLLAIQKRGPYNGSGPEDDRARYEARAREAILRTEQLLGPELHPLWREYQDTARERWRLTLLNNKLGGAALPEDTVRVVAGAMTEAARLRLAGARAISGGNSNTLNTSRDIDVMIEEARLHRAAVRDAASRHLTRSQLEALDEQLKQEQISAETFMNSQKEALKAREAAAKAGSGG